MHLYIHIPFCHRICPYCAFHKHTPAKTNIREFVQALLIEAQSYAPDVNNSTSPLTTIYFGGGTPSMLSDTYLKTLFSGLRDIFDCSAVQEITFETNPATFNAKRALFFRQLGITRVSLGIQSFDAHILHLLGREHTPEQAKHSIKLLREVGMPEINIDLMFSLPGQSLSVWEDTLQQAIDCQPEHISAYNLNYEEDTEFFEKLGAGEWSVNPDLEADFFDLTHSKLTSAGFRHYETSNFSQPNHESQHNLSYWLGEDYIGLGPGAVGTLHQIRTENKPDTTLYIAKTLETGLPPRTSIPISLEELREERIALLLRTDLGLPLSYILPEQQIFLSQLYEEGLAIKHPKKLILSDKGRLLVDQIALNLI